LAPLGAVSMDFGSQGELLGLYSNYVRNLNVTNQIKIDVAQAKLLAQTSVHSLMGGEQKPFPHTEGGKILAWVLSSAEPQSVGKFAYQFFIQGYQVIVDAETGEILFQRDKRQF